MRTSPANLISGAYLLTIGERGTGKSLTAERTRALHAPADPIRGLTSDCIYVDDWSEFDSGIQMRISSIRDRFADRTTNTPMIYDPDECTTADVDRAVKRLLRPEPDYDSIIESIYSLPRKPGRDWADWLNQRHGLLPRSK